jgi:hypothetical protein
VSFTDTLVAIAVGASDFEPLRRVQEAIGLRLLPIIEDTVRAMREWYESLPGMPYTAPSLWDADQMIGDRGGR